MAWEIGHPLNRDGTSQRQRLPSMLSPEQVPIDARSPEELLAMLYRIAKQFGYYNLEDNADGTLQDFFPAEFLNGGALNVGSIQNYLKTVNKRANNGPFITLLLAFLHLYRYLQDDINRLSGEHLKYYYEQRLGFQRRPPQPDRVHVLFELSPQTNQHLLPAGTELKGGKDALGRPLSYTTDRDIVVNQTRIAQLKTVLIEPDGRIFAADIADSADGIGAALDGKPPSWPAFGNPTYMQPSTVGFAIASHLLFLQEGQRIITVTLGFSADSFTALDSTETERLFASLIPYASGANGWIKLDLRDLRVSHSNVILTIEAQADQAAIVPFNAESLTGKLDTTWPVLKLLLDHRRPGYHQLKNMQLTQIDLRITVDATADQPGLQQLVVQNDQSVLDVGGSFQPFGAQPTAGSQFYIGSQEAFSKPLDNFTLHIRWADLPNDPTGFAGYYINYSPTVERNDVFKVDMESLHNNRWHSIASDENLFDLPTGPLRAERSLIGNRIDLSLNTELPKIEQYETSLPQGFIRLRLKRDFGHKVYPKLFAKQATLNPENLPNPPYTPTIQSISLGYQVSQRISVGRVNAGDTSTKLFHILPFGSKKISTAASTEFLPTLARGNLYIGLEKFQAPQNIQLLFQALEGSAESINAIGVQDVRWHYLAASGWEQLGAQEIYTDTTEGLQQPGIVALSIGRDAISNATSLPDGLHWLRASIDKDPAGAARMIAIHPQAVTAVFVDSDNDPNRFTTPLPVNSITALSRRDSAIKKVSQPYSSFNGVPAEQNAPFFSRVSERLRHKQRAITLWDYERLVLSQFPQIYKAKSIPHAGFGADNRYSEFIPGHCSVVVIPQSQLRNSVNPLEPKASVALLEKIRRYLQSYCSGFTGNIARRLQVLNPRYEPIRLSFSVGFREGFDGGFYADVLNNALRRYLSPWAFNEGADIAFGGKVYKSQLLAYVEDQEYVDYVTDFKLFHIEAGPGIGDMCIDSDLIVRDSELGDEVEVAVASTAASILVSADMHDIGGPKSDEFPCDEPDACVWGIGCAYVNIDFEVGFDSV